MIFLKVLTLIKQVVQENVDYVNYYYYYYFLNINFNYQKYLFDGCHDMSMKANSMHNLAIAYNKGNAYHINFVFITKDNAINLIKKCEYNG